MMSSLVDLALWAALIFTSASVIVLHRRLKAFDGDLAGYRSALVKASLALDAASGAVTVLTREGKDAALVLGSRIGEAQATVAALDDARRRLEAASESSIRVYGRGFPVRPTPFALVKAAPAAEPEAVSGTC